MAIKTSDLKPKTSGVRLRGSKNFKKWWDMLNDMGPTTGFLPNAKKCWLITKPEKEEMARKVFAGTAVNVSSQGQRYLGAVLGSREYFEDYSM